MLYSLLIILQAYSLQSVTLLKNALRHITVFLSILQKFQNGLFTEHLCMAAAIRYFFVILGKLSLIIN